MNYEYFEEECWFCGKRIPVSQHHLWRASKRKTSPVVWLCQKCHDKATRNKQFEIHLQELYLKLKGRTKLSV